MIKKHTSLGSVLIHREKLLFVCSPNDPLATGGPVEIHDLDRTPFVWREKGTQTLALVKGWFQEKAAGDFPRQALSLSNLEAAKRIVEEGYGITIVPETAARREIAAGLLKRLDVRQFDLTVDYGLFYRKGSSLSRVAESFLDTLCTLGLFSHGENLNARPYKGRKAVR